MGFDRVRHSLHGQSDHSRTAAHGPRIRGDRDRVDRRVGRDRRADDRCRISRASQGTRAGPPRVLASIPSLALFRLGKSRDRRRGNRRDADGDRAVHERPPAETLLRSRARVRKPRRGGFEPASCRRPALSYFSRTRRLPARIVRTISSRETLVLTPGTSSGERFVFAGRITKLRPSRLLTRTSSVLAASSRSTARFCRAPASLSELSFITSCV